MKTFQCSCLILILLVFGCHKKPEENEAVKNIALQDRASQYITVLGIAQDAGFPQINCEKKCCKVFYESKESKKLVSSLGLVDKASGKKWLFDATPDINEQIQILKEKHLDNGKVIDGIFLTHAHMGHYTGLMQLGREAMGAQHIPVYAMPRMKSYLETNGPWSQLVKLNNIELIQLKADSTLILNTNLKVIPYEVPHRDEYSETVGYKIVGANKSALFIPDINKWQKWNRNIIEEVKSVDYAFLDATFYNNGELNRDMSQIPHPFIAETMYLFKNEPLAQKNKIYFIHFNHSNPALISNSRVRDSIKKLGFNFARQEIIFPL